MLGMGASAVTDDAGHFVIHGVPEGEVAYLAAAPSNEYVGAVRGVDVRFSDLDGVEILQLSKLQIEGQLRGERGL